MLTDLGPNTLEIRGPLDVVGERSLLAPGDAQRLDFRAGGREDPGPGSARRSHGAYGRVEFLVRVAVLSCLLALMVPTLASADRYRSQRAGHPLRIVAYALHPVGVILDTLIFKPAWSLAQYEPLRTLVGMETPIDGVAVARPSTNPFLEPYREEP